MIDEALLKMLAWLWVPFGALIGLAWRQQSEKLIDHKAEVNRRFEQLGQADHDRQRDIGKLFDELRDQNKLAEGRHLQLMQALHEGLNQKVDK